MKNSLGVSVVDSMVRVGVFLLCGAAGVSRAETNVWDGSGGNVNWSTAGNWTNGASPVGSSELVVMISGANNIGTTDTPMNQDVAVPLDLNRFESLDVAGGSDREVFLGGGRLNFVSNGTSQPTIYQNRDGNLTFRTPVSVPAGTTLNIGNRTYRIHLEGELSGEGGLRFQTGGGGELELKSPANSYTGGTVYVCTGGAGQQWGRLRISASNALGVGPVSIGGGNMNLLEGANTQAGGLTFHNTTVHTNDFTLSAAASVFAGEGVTNASVAAAAVTLGGAVDLNAYTLYLRGQRNTAGTISGAISEGGATAVYKMDLGRWTLSGANTFTGRVTVSNGTLSLGAVSALSPAAPVTVAGGLYDLGGFTATNGALTISGGTISNGTLSAASVAGTDAGVIRASLAGEGGLTKSGAGTLTLAASNLYTGVTTVNAGILQLAKRAALYNGDTAQWTDARIVVNSGATLALNVGGPDEFTDSDVGVLAGLGSGTGGFKAGSLLGLDTATAAGGEFVCASAIGGTGSQMLGLHKLGAGTLALNAANSYTGATRITSGVVSVGTLANGGSASGIGASSNAAARLVFDGGALRYTGATASTDRRFTVNAGKNAIFEVAQPGATLTFASVVGSSIPGGVTLTKNGPGALSFGLDGAGVGQTWGYLVGINTLVLNEGSFLNVANDTPQINVSAQAATGPALVLGDGAYLGASVPVDVTASNTEQIVRYIGTNATATIAAGLFSGPNAGGSNTKTFDVNDGAADIDLLSSANYGIYPTTPTLAVSDIRKTGAGTLKLSGAGAQFRGTMTVRNGRLVVGGNVTYGGNSVLGNATSVVQVADVGTAPSNAVSLVFDGPYTFSRGICVNPYGASATVGNISTSRAVFAGQILLSNTVQLVSSTSGTNVTLFSGAISGFGGVAKTGTGTVVLAAANTYTGLTSVAAGTLRLAAAERIADASGLRLTGGTFDTAGFSETLGTLDVDGDAVIDFGNGACELRFAASDSQAWSGTLALRNWSASTNGGGVDRLYVGSSKGGLTQDQLARFALPYGRAVKQLETGEVVMIPLGSVLLLR